jgi:hypothetical protein
MSSPAQMCIFARCVASELKIIEKFVMLYPMKGQTKGSDLLPALFCCFEKHNLDISKDVGIVTDGTISMIGYRKWSSYSSGRTHTK